jgi:hypothetical protein
VVIGYQRVDLWLQVETGGTQTSLFRSAFHQDGSYAQNGSQADRTVDSVQSTNHGSQNNEVGKFTKREASGPVYSLRI